MPSEERRGEELVRALGSGRLSLDYLPEEDDVEVMARRAPWDQTFTCPEDLMASRLPVSQRITMGTSKFE